MIRKLLISRRYASSFVSYASLAGVDVDAVCAELRGLCVSLRESKMLHTLFVNRSIPIFVKMRAWSVVSAHLKFSTIVDVIVRIMVKNGRSELIEDFLSNLELLWLKKHGYGKVEVRFACGVGQKVQDSFMRVVGEVMPFKPVFSVCEDARVIGGAVVMWDSNMVDMSVCGKVGRMLEFMEKI